MTRLYLAGILLIVLSADSLARMDILPRFLAYPVLVKVQGGGEASGFYYSSGENLYLITAKHVVVDPLSGMLKGTELRLKSYGNGFPTKLNKMVAKVHLKNLYDDSRVFPDPLADIVVLQLANQELTDDGRVNVTYDARYIEMVEQQAGLMTVGKKELALYEEVLISNEAYIFGYPGSIGLKQMPQIDYELPLLRRGVIAGKNLKARTIILDCPSYYGNSGGPVCQVEHKGNHTYFRIIGIVSQFVPFVEAWENKTHKYANVEISNSGYSVVVPIDVALTLIEDVEHSDRKAISRTAPSSLPEPSHP